MATDMVARLLTTITFLRTVPFIAVATSSRARGGKQRKTTRHRRNTRLGSRVKSTPASRRPCKPGLSTTGTEHTTLESETPHRASSPIVVRATPPHPINPMPNSRPSDSLDNSTTLETHPTQMKAFCAAMMLWEVRRSSSARVSKCARLGGVLAVGNPDRSGAERDRSTPDDFSSVFECGRNAGRIGSPRVLWVPPKANGARGDAYDCSDLTDPAEAPS